jgi:hypothetical protein
MGEFILLVLICVYNNKKKKVRFKNLMLARNTKKTILVVFMLVFLSSFLLLGQTVLAESQTDTGFAGGSGTEDDPFLIANAEQLGNVRNYLDAHYHFKLINDIDLGVAPYNEGEGWMPIGSYVQQFKGFFDGNGKTISGLYINREDEEDVGLFGWLGKEGCVVDLILKDVNVFAYGYAGGLAGGSTEGEVYSVYVSGTVAGRIHIGGLIGYNGMDSHVISCHSDCDVNGESYVGGLISTSEGITVNCYTSGTVAGLDIVGGLVGCEGGIIENSLSSATVIGTSYVGGLVGVLWDASWDNQICDSYATGSVMGSQYVGGLVGINDDSSIYNSYSIASVNGTSYVGGLVGINNYGLIEFCFAAGSVSGDMNVGGLIGYNDDGLVYDSYYDKDVTGQSDMGNGEPKSTSELMIRSTFKNWDFSYTWTIIEGYDYPMLRWQDEAPTSGFDLWIPRGSAEPGVETELRITDAVGEDGELLTGRKEVIIYNEIDNATIFQSGVEFVDGEASIAITLNTLGLNTLRVAVEDVFYTNTVSVEVLVVEFAGGSGTADDPYLIADADDLNNVRYNLTAHYKLINDIDLGVAPYNEGEGWLPIGSSSMPFVGYFDGDGKYIRNLYINRIDSHDVGLFSTIDEGATVDYVLIENADVTGRRYVGALVGWNYNGNIFYCVAMGTVRGITDIGGLVGENNGYIDSSNTYCFVSGDTYIGGLAGNNFHEINNSYATGNVLGSENVGGLIGYNDGSIMNSYTTGIVNGDDHIGGLVGFNYREGNIATSYTTGYTTGLEDVGGLVGHNLGNISECFTIGNTDAESSVGGLIGFNEGEVSMAYALGTVVAGTDAGGLIGYNEGSVSQCYAKGLVLAAYNVGGLIGYNDKGEVIYCYATGEVFAQEYYDAFIGWNEE